MIVFAWFGVKTRANNHRLVLYRSKLNSQKDSNTNSDYLFPPLTSTHRPGDLQPPKKLLHDGVSPRSTDKKKKNHMQWSNPRVWITTLCA